MQLILKIEDKEFIIEDKNQLNELKEKLLYLSDLIELYKDTNDTQVFNLILKNNNH